MGLRLVCLSDTHGRHGEVVVPDGDVVVHAGDFTDRGRREEVAAFAAWFLALPHASKVVVAGNHDALFAREPDAARALLADAVYLEDEGATVAGLRFWGSPWQPEHGGWSFGLPRGDALAGRWSLAPAEVDVLVTHTPRAGTLDVIEDGLAIGCEALRDAFGRIRPRLHVFGHAHDSRGVEVTASGLAVNASVCDGRYRVANAPVVVDWTDDGPRVVTI